MSRNEFKNIKVLFVEDEENIRINAITYLKRLFEEVYEAKDANEAFEIIDNSSFNSMRSKKTEGNPFGIVKSFYRFNQPDRTFLNNIHTPILIAPNLQGNFKHQGLIAFNNFMSGD